METDDAIGKVLVPEEDLQRRVAELGAEVSRDYEGRPPLLVAILKGAVPFLADLMRHLEIDCELDFMAVSSYGSSTDSSGMTRQFTVARAVCGNAFSACPASSMVATQVVRIWAL